MAEVGDHVHRVGCRAAVAEREQRARPPPDRRAGPRPRPAARRRCRRASARAARRPRAPSRAPSCARPRTTASRSLLLLAQERIEEARGARVVQLPRRAALEQAAVVEEHVHELPEHVVERLDQLLADRRVRRGRLELPLGPGALEGEREAAALARERQRRGAQSPNAIAMSSGSTASSTCDSSGPPSAVSASAGSARLPTITGMHELDRHVAGVRARRRRARRARSAGRRGRSARPSGGRAARAAPPPPRRRGGSPRVRAASARSITPAASAWFTRPPARPRRAG